MPTLTHLTAPLYQGGSETLEIEREEQVRGENAVLLSLLLQVLAIDSNWKVGDLPF